jgi:hypothetical protein
LRLTALSSALLAALALLACSAGNDPNATGAGGSGAGTSNGGAAQGGNTFGTGGGVNPQAIGTLSGRVVAPEGTIPISGALVYLTSSLPPAIPDGVYCDACVELDESIAHGFSNADGTFEIPTYNDGDQYLVVQKGQFRRVRPITIASGALQADPTATRMPSRMDKANGDDIPKMVIQEGAYDDILTSLVELGIDQDQITLVACAGFSCDSVFDDPAMLSQYHIAFVPCSSCDGGTSQQADNIRDFVAAGGKYYVTDWSYQWMQSPFPGYVDFYEESGDACTLDNYTAPATQMDPELQAWLTAQGVPNPSFEAAYTYIDALNTVATTDVNNQPVMVTPKTWITGATPQGNKPLTISFEQQCGRVLFSTYHSESSDGLLPQELALLYVILEVGVCLEVPVPE